MVKLIRLFCAIPFIVIGALLLGLGSMISGGSIDINFKLVDEKGADHE